jgi:hypothetical protein
VLLLLTARSNLPATQAQICPGRELFATVAITKPPSAAARETTPPIYPPAPQGPAKKKTEKK